MNISYRKITITEENYNDYNLTDLVAISIAAGGAMGDPGAIEFITSQGRYFYANPVYENITLEQVNFACPLLSEIQLGIFGCIEKPKGWEYIYLGYGNHLLINDSIYIPFQLGTKQKQEQIKQSLLYNNWKNIVEECIDGTVYKNERIDKLKGVIDGQAIGDALGLATEFMDDIEMAQKYPNGVNDYSDIYQDAHRRRWKVGEWTDDTDMMLCIANAVIEDKGVNLTHIAQNFKAWADCEPLGIGNNTYKVLSFGDYVDNGHRYSSLWQFVFEFAYCIFAVAFAEEFVFRGFIFKRILEIGGRESVAVIGSSVLFGIFHLFGENVLQMFMTAVLGVLFCLFRSKIRSCSLLSLILAHGIYDALITVWSSVL